MLGLSGWVTQIKLSFRKLSDKQEKQEEKISDIRLELAKMPDQDYHDNRYDKLEKYIVDLNSTVTDMRIAAK